MSSISLLDRLCALCGIDVDYTDVWNQKHAVPDDTKYKLLAAMHVDASRAGLENVLDEIEARHWRRLLPPTQVLKENDSAPYTALSISTEKARTAFRWCLTLESGAVVEGHCISADLTVLEERQIAGETFVRFALPLPSALAGGYHRLEVEQLAIAGMERTTTGLESDKTNLSAAHNVATMSLIVVPNTCYRPPALSENQRIWGPVVQLYALRSQRNWGIGDFTDLAKLVDFAAPAGAGMVGLNPLHALFPNDPARASPYSPSSRRFLNVLYIDVEAIEEFAESTAAANMVQEPQFQAQLQALRASELVNYPAVGALKLKVLEILFQHFQCVHLDQRSQRALAFRRFKEQGSVELHHHALFEALQEHFSRIYESVLGWQAWPSDYHDPTSEKVAAFAATHAERIDFYTYLQWQAELQLATVAQCSRERGLAVGLYQDLAVGVAAEGAECWSESRLYAQNVQVGAPPDEFNLKGQGWGLPPQIPYCLRDVAYAPLIAVLRKNMRHAGALRIDHVMGLMRLFWVPAGAAPSTGAYVQYPLDDLIGIVALESQRNRCMVIGEDLGTVPPQVRDALDRFGILSTRLFYFETIQDGAQADEHKGKHNGEYSGEYEYNAEFKAPANYPINALVAVGTHDLPTLAGFWLADDLNVRHVLGLYPSDQLYATQIMQRVGQRGQILHALERHKLLSAGGGLAAYPEMSADLMLAIHIYLARTPAKVMAIQMEDVFGQLHQVNLPVSGDKYPNWQRKLPVEIEAWSAEPRLQALLHALRRIRDCAAIAMPATGIQAQMIPRATYRLQFSRKLTFVDAEHLIPYLDALGISHCYASPLFKARPGSTHGYDIIDHAVLNPEIGTELEFDRYVDVLRRFGMGLILDIVPNHMAVMGSDNVWWLDVLENGQSSRYAEFFDIDWQPQNQELRNKVLVPVLSDQYGNVLDGGGLKLTFNRQCGEFSIWYEEHRFPVDPCEYPRIIKHRWQHLTETLSTDDSQIILLQSLVTAFGHLPPQIDTAAEKREERERDKKIHQQQLAALCDRSTEIANFLHDNVDAFNGGKTEGDPDSRSFELLHQLIKAQAYRLGFWRVASDEINYRHFADVINLAGLCIERDEVFDATHRMAMELVANKKIDGLRIDHTDGLFDPLRYFRRLQQAFQHVEIDSDNRHNNGTASDMFYAPYVVIEKILAEHERLPSHWPVHGTTGYCFSSLINGLFVYAENESRMDHTYAAFIGERIDFSEILHRCKKSIMQTTLASALNVLANQLSHIAQMDRHTCDFTTSGLRNALIDITACFPVYRTYITADGVSHADRQAVEWAVSVAKKRSRDADTSIFDFVQKALLTELMEGKGQVYRDAVMKFAMRFQQFSSPVMAKGMEDTSFYIYHRLTSLNEVGSDPRTFGISISAFHATNRERAKSWPHAMLTTSTHDSKRSEDVRARINVLSELPGLWRLRLRRWRRINRSKRTHLDGGIAPTRNDEYLLYQTLIGCWPLEPLEQDALTEFCERIEAYMLKAIREAKQMSSWIAPNLAYENAVSTFIKAIIGTIATSERNPFLADFLPFQQLVSRVGMLNSLSQTLIKLTSPGVPDIYQGNEIWNFSLVDPDNRRPVDYQYRRKLLDELQRNFPADSNDTINNIIKNVHKLLLTMEDGRIKLYLTWKSLRLRKQLEDLFLEGSYLPLQVDGLRREQLCAFARSWQNLAIVVIAPRFFTLLMGQETLDPIGAAVWMDTYVDFPETLAGTNWENVFTGEILQLERGERRFAVSQLLAHFPYSLLQLI